MAGTFDNTDSSEVSNGKEEQLITVFPNEETVNIFIQDLRVECVWSILRRRSEFFNALYGCHDKGTDLILDETNCPAVKAVRLLNRLHQFSYDELSWDADLAELCTRWLITDYINAYRKLMIDFVDSIRYRPDRNITREIPYCCLHFLNGCPVVDFLPQGSPIFIDSTCEVPYRHDIGIIEDRDRYIGIIYSVTFQGKTTVSLDQHFPNDGAVKLLLSPRPCKITSVSVDMFWEIMGVAFNNTAYRFLTKSTLMEILKDNRDLFRQRELAKHISEEESSVVHRALVV